MFEDIYALPPGCILKCDTNGVEVRRYWDLTFANHPSGNIREEEYAEQLEALLRECVGLHLTSDVPFGAFLSGGVDSSTIVALMSQFLNEPVKTYSVGFEGQGQAFSELPYARVVANKFHTDHHEVFIRPSHLVDLAEKIVWHLDQPLAEHATLANYMVAELAARDVKMVLTGEGGDELFAGYARYSGERLSPFFQRIPQAAKSLALAVGSRLPGLRRQKLALYAFSQSEEVTRFVNWFPLFNPEMKQALLSKGLKASLSGYDADYVFAQHLASTNATASVNRMLYVDTKLWLPDLLLARGDKMSMAVSLEARVPLLDHKLVEFAAQLPDEWKLNGFTTKRVLRESMKGLLPESILNRPKMGFPVPFAAWTRGPWNAVARDVLLDSRSRQRGIIDPMAVDRLLRDHAEGRTEGGDRIWSLLNLELWHRTFIDNEGVQMLPAPRLRRPVPDMREHHRGRASASDSHEPLRGADAPSNSGGGGVPAALGTSGPRTA